MYAVHCTSYSIHYVLIKRWISDTSFNYSHIHTSYFRQSLPTYLFDYTPGRGREGREGRWVRGEGRGDEQFREVSDLGEVREIDTELKKLASRDPDPNSSRHREIDPDDIVTTSKCNTYDEVISLAI